MKAYQGTDFPDPLPSGAKGLITLRNIDGPNAGKPSNIRVCIGPNMALTELDADSVAFLNVAINSALGIIGKTLDGMYAAHAAEGSHFFLDVFLMTELIEKIRGNL